MKIKSKLKDSMFFQIYCLDVFQRKRNYKLSKRSNLYFFSLYSASEFVPTVIPFIQSRNLDVGHQRRSKSILQPPQNEENNPFINQVFNHHQVSSNNVPSILSNSNVNTNAVHSDPFPAATDRVSSINTNTGLSNQVSIFRLILQPK